MTRRSSNHDSPRDCENENTHVKRSENCILQHTHLYIWRDTCMFREKEELCEKINVTGGNESGSWGIVLLEWWEGHEGERCSTHHPEGSPPEQHEWSPPSLLHLLLPPSSVFFLCYSPMPSLIDCEAGEPIAVALELEKTVLIKMLVSFWGHSMIVSWVKCLCKSNNWTGWYVTKQ